MDAPNGGAGGLSEEISRAVSTAIQVDMKEILAQLASLKESNKVLLYELQCLAADGNLEKYEAASSHVYCSQILRALWHFAIVCLLLAL